MDLTRKSASAIENEYKQVFLRFLKETNLKHCWYEYIGSVEYDSYVSVYLEDNPYRSRNWYDRNHCSQILGMCYFENYLKTRYNDKYSIVGDTYDLFNVFLSIFWNKEFERFCRIFDYNGDHYIRNVFENGNEYRQNLIRKWLTFKGT